jgi:hypothetical protein
LHFSYKFPEIPAVEVGKNMASNFAVLSHTTKLQDRQSIIMLKQLLELSPL